MNFSQLLWGLGVSHSGGDPEISGLDYNSRRVEPGFVFVTMRGESSDGNRHIDSALKNGAVAVVTDSKSEQPRRDVPWAVIPIAIYGIGFAMAMPSISLITLDLFPTRRGMAASLQGFVSHHTHEALQFTEHLFGIPGR